VVAADPLQYAAAHLRIAQVKQVPCPIEAIAVFLDRDGVTADVAQAFEQAKRDSRVLKREPCTHPSQAAA
jgi:hypothetical protein